MRTTEPVVIRRADYAPPSWRVRHASLRFELEPTATRVTARLEIERDGAGEAPIALDGVGIELESISIDGAPLEASAYALEPERLVLHAAPARFALETVGTVNPDANTALEGLYRSSGTFCTQCEAEGFRKITWYPDRPDVLATFDVEIEADAALAPVLLSNGNLVADETLPGGRRRARWHDPHPKPSYLFALVAGGPRRGRRRPSPRCPASRSGCRSSSRRTTRTGARSRWGRCGARWRGTSGSTAWSTTSSAS